MAKNKKPKNMKRSVGLLYRAKKTKNSSPNMLGTISIQRRTLEELLAQIERTNANEIEGQIAAWFYAGYISIELSPKWVIENEVNCGRDCWWTDKD
jgi:hypothetical protein